MLTPSELDRIADTLRREGTYPGYPAPEDRLRLDEPGLLLTGSILVVPGGPWHIPDHPNRRTAPAHLLDPDVLAKPRKGINANDSARWRTSGLTLDQYGRPVHPDWEQLLGDRRIGLPTGPGFFWTYGINKTVDAVHYRRRPTGLEVLLIKRRVGRRWALPGGFQDHTDRSPEAAARRELREETGLRPAADAELLTTSCTVGPMATLHAWTENTAVLIHQDLKEAEPSAGDDAIDARWFTYRDALNLDLYDVHANYIKAALNRI